MKNKDTFATVFCPKAETGAIVPSSIAIVIIQASLLPGNKLAKPVLAGKKKFTQFFKDC